MAEAAASEAAVVDSRAAEFRLAELVTVVGRPEKMSHIPGTAHVISLEELREQRHDDVHRVLQSVPGVNLQEEDGYGFRPNIGMRGTGVERSQKITLMEDGVLIAPAPYSAPAAYYFPTVSRMEGIEVRKGSAAIKQGPYTNGGAINLISAAIPSSLAASLDVALGEDSTGRAQGQVGGATERFGWLFQTYQFDTDGFKRLDGGGETGTEIEDYLGKLRFSTSARAKVAQSLELKLGRTKQDGFETYLGLTEEDFRQDPFRRYRGSSEDHFTSDHEQVQVQHFAMLSSRLDLVSTLYQNDFFRDWFKNESVRGVSNAEVLSRPAEFPLELGILRGEIDSDGGDLRLRHNRRSYESRGISSALGLRMNYFGADHHLEVGVRYHEDVEDRFQEEDLFSMFGGSLELDALGLPGSQSNRLAGANAFAAFAQDRLSWKRLSLLPGLRYESIRYRRRDFSKLDPTRSEGVVGYRDNQVDVFVPGIGLAVDLEGGHSVFVGAHRGFSPPGASSTKEVEEEESTNVELGYRFGHSRLRAELTGFYSDYSNLLGTETVVGGGASTGEIFNGGAVEVQGIEAALDRRFQLGGVQLPLRLSCTWTVAEFQSSFFTSFADWGPHVEAGDRVPYIPENQLQLSLGAISRLWSGHLNTSYADAMRTKAGRGPLEGQGTDSRVVLDLLVERKLARFSVYGQIRNLSDEVYIAARRPYGVRPGLPRTFLAGVSVDF